MFDKIDSITESLVINIAGLQGFVDCLGSKDALRDALERSLAQIFAMKGRLIIVGMGKSGLIARKLAATFSSTGTPAYFVHPAEASHGDLGMIQTGDVILMLSWSGETRELGDILTYAARFDIPTIAITGAAESTLAKRANSWRLSAQRFANPVRITWPRPVPRYCKWRLAMPWRSACCKCAGSAKNRFVIFIRGGNWAPALFQ